MVYDEAMKNMRVLAIILSSLLVLTACMKVSMSIDVNRDGTGTMEGSFLFSKKIAEIAEMSGEDSGDFCAQVTEDGEMGIEPPEGAEEIILIEDDEWCGYSFTAPFEDFEIPDDEGDAPRFSVIGDEITFSMEMDIGQLGLDEIAGDSGSDDMEFQQLMAIFDIPEPEFVIAVTLPGEITNHNADSLEGSTLTWNLDLMDEQESGSLSATANMSSGDSGSSNGLIIGIAVAVGLLIAGFVARQWKSSKNLDGSREEDGPSFE